MGVRLSEDETWAYLESGHTGILTTLRRDGAPVSLPVWYVVVDRRVYVRTPAGTKKVVRLTRDDRCSFLVESGTAWRELAAVHLSGRAVVVDDDAELASVGDALDAKYAPFRTRRQAMPDATRSHYAQSSVLYRIEPEGRVLTWNNAKLELGS